MAVIINRGNASFQPIEDRKLIDNSQRQSCLMSVFVALGNSGICNYSMSWL